MNKTFYLSGPMRNEMTTIQDDKKQENTINNYYDKAHFALFLNN